jgi:hypothetical protein
MCFGIVTWPLTVIVGAMLLRVGITNLEDGNTAHIPAQR